MLCCVYLVCIEPFGLCVIVCFEVGIYLLYLLLGLCIVSSLFQEYFGHFFVFNLSDGSFHLAAGITLTEHGLEFRI